MWSGSACSYSVQGISYCLAVCYTNNDERNSGCFSRNYFVRMTYVVALPVDIIFCLPENSEMPDNPDALNTSAVPGSDRHPAVTSNFSGLSS